MKWLTCCLLPLLAGCAFFEGFTRLGADLTLGLGGLLAEAVDLRLEAHVAIERVGNEKPVAVDAGGPDRGFL